MIQSPSISEVTRSILAGARTIKDFLTKTNKEAIAQSEFLARLTSG